MTFINEAVHKKKSFTFIIGSFIKVYICMFSKGSFYFRT